MTRGGSRFLEGRRVRQEQGKERGPERRLIVDSKYEYMVVKIIDQMLSTEIKGEGSPGTARRRDLESG